MKAQYITEKFKEESDPIKDMGIGIKPEEIIEQFIHIIDKRYDTEFDYDKISMTSGDSNDIYYITCWDSDFEDIDIYFAESVEAAEDIIAEHSLTNLKPEIGWFVISQADDTAGPLYSLPNNLKPIIRELDIIRYGSERYLSDKIKQLQKELKKTNSIKKTIIWTLNKEYINKNILSWKNFRHITI